MLINETLAKRVLDVVDAGLCHGMGQPKPGEMCVEAAVCYAMDLPHGDNPSCVSPAIRSLKITLNDKNWSSNTSRAKGLRRLAIAQLGSKDVVNDVEFAARVSKMTIRKQVSIALRIAASIHPEEKHKIALEDAAKLCETEGTQSAESAESAESAAWNAAESAAWSAAKSAAESAAESAAWSAAWSAKSAAWNAAESAAWSAESAAESAAMRAAMIAAKSAAKSAESAAWSAESAKSAESAAWSAESAAWSAESAAMRAAYDKILSDFAEDVVQILITMKAPGTQFLNLTE